MMVYKKGWKEGKKETLSVLEVFRLLISYVRESETHDATDGMYLVRDLVRGLWLVVNQFTVVTQVGYKV